MIGQTHFGVPTIARAYLDVWDEVDVGVTWKQGKLGPLVIADQRDTSRVWHGDHDAYCWCCRNDVLHSQRAHYAAVFEKRDQLNAEMVWGA